MGRNNDFFSSPQHAWAQRRVGHQQGLERGYQEGEQAGYQRGFNDGHARGWDEAITKANIEIEKCGGYIREHVADKERLQEALDLAANAIDKTKAYVSTLEADNSRLLSFAKDADAAITSLEARIKESTAALTAETEMSAARTWLFNGNLVLTQVMLEVIQSLTQEPDSPETDTIETMLVEAYEEIVDGGIAAGHIRERLEKDAAFAEALPGLHQFLTKILASVVERRQWLSTFDDDDPDWVPSGI